MLGRDSGILDLAPFFRNDHLFIGLLRPGTSRDLVSSRFIQGIFEQFKERFLHLFLLSLINHSFLDHLSSIKLIHVLERGDLLVHQRLGETGLIQLVMSISSIPDNIDYHIFVEFLSVLKGKSHHSVNHLRVIRIHVENRRTNGFGNLSGIQPRSPIPRTGREPDLIISHNMDHPSRSVVFQVLELIGLIDDTLPSMCGITVEDNPNVLFPVFVIFEILDCPGFSVDQGVDGLQMGRVGEDAESNGMVFFGLDVTGHP